MSDQPAARTIEGLDDAPTVSAILPTFNRAEVVSRTVRHLAAQHYPLDRLEIIVVDNSTDGTPAEVRRLAERYRLEGGPTVVLLAVEERLPAVKRNLGLRAASGDLVLWMNDDLWLEPGAVAAHVQRHRRLGTDAAVLGHCRQSPEMEQTPFIAAYEPFAYDRIPSAEQPLPYSFFWSMNLSMPRQVMLERNLVFHEDWRHIGHEDVELGRRWTRAGLPLLYEPGARGDHFHPHTVISACRLQDSVGRGLRDLEVLVDDPGLLERYGVRHRSNSARGYARFLVRDLLFNRYTAPWLARRLDERSSPSAVDRWLYWKVLLHHTGRAYRSESPRAVACTPTRPAVAV